MLTKSQLLAILILPFTFGLVNLVYPQLSVTVCNAFVQLLPAPLRRMYWHTHLRVRIVGALFIILSIFMMTKVIRG